MLRYVFFIYLIILVCSSCKNENSKEDILVSIEGESLTRDDLSNMLPDNLSREDSLKFSEKIIRTWIDNHLILKVASSELPNIDKINELVDQYRAQLITHEYRKMVVLNESSNYIIPEDSLLAYYNTNQNKFVLEEPVIKGIYIKIADNSPKLKDVRRWIKSSRQADIEKLEKYGLDDAIVYDFFRDKWMAWSNIEKNIPNNFSNANDFVKTNKTFEISKNGFVYLLNISDFKVKGTIMPFDFAKDEIRDMYVNANQLAVDRQIINQLYESALE